jgi:hypothetical protein
MAVIQQGCLVVKKTWVLSEVVEVLDGENIELVIEIWVMGH